MTLNKHGADTVPETYNTSPSTVDVVHVPNESVKGNVLCPTVAILVDDLHVVLRLRVPLTQDVEPLLKLHQGQLLATRLDLVDERLCGGPTQMQTG